MSAYTAVQARSALGMAQPAQPPAPRATEWPASVREFVSRCLSEDNDLAGISREEVQARLTHIIRDSIARNALYTTDWDNLPLPQYQIQEEKRAAALLVNNQLVKPKKSIFDAATSDATANTQTPKKRKSADAFDSSQIRDNEPRSSKQKTNQSNAFEDRITYTDRPWSKKESKKQRNRVEKHSAGNDSKSMNNLEKRRQRFGYNFATEGSSAAGSLNESSVPTAQQGPVVGTNMELEKKYFRLTSAPKPEAVRPLHVLERTLDHLKKKWKADGNYAFICDQFKSLRQDLTVQHIKTVFTVNVYETHARIALEKGDLGEYNQCQTQLRGLYKQQLGGHPTEFLAYRILYFIYTSNWTDMNDVLADLTAADRRQGPVKHALDVRSAVAAGNYHRLFQLYLQAPHMGGYLMDMFVARERLAALAKMCKTYKIVVPLRFITEELGFESDPEAAGFICDHGGEKFLTSNDSGIVTFACSQAGAVFETAKQAAFKSVDIKGQI